jgi:DNA-binding GntR family transcriptional regulator
MSELRDYQQLMVDNLIEDINTIVPLTDAQFQAIQEKLESRIATYDRERWDDIDREFPTAMVRALQDIRC